MQKAKIKNLKEILKMKKVIYLALLFFGLISCKEDPKQFDVEALNDTLITIEGKETTLSSILEKHKGKTIVIDIWASWCGDCINGMPKVKALQEEYTDVSYLFFSLDRGQESWKRGIEKYNVVGEHYYLPSGKKSGFGDFVNISWIPRYMVINKSSEIVVFDVIEADDDKLIKALKN